MSDSPKIIIITESTRQSWQRDASTYALFVALIGTGWLLNSEAMQWAGAIVGFMTVLSQAYKGRMKFTVKEARAELDRIESERRAA